MRLMSKFICLVACSATLGVVSAAAQPFPPAVISATSSGNDGAGPNGIAVTPTELLFTQPFQGSLQNRGIYTENLAAGTSSLVTTIPGGGPAENYLAISPGLGGFTAGDTFVTGISTSSSSNDAVYRNNLTTAFIDPVPGSQNHVGITFDTSGTFGFNLIVTAVGLVTGYNSTGTATFSYTVPLGPVSYDLEGATVAPLTYGPCPGCLFVTAVNSSNVDNPTPNPANSGAIYYVLPGTAGTPSPGTLTLWSTTPGIVEPEGIVFVGNNLSCTLTGPGGVGYSYFVSGYAAATQIDETSDTGAILAYTPAQLAPFTGQLLVPDEGYSMVPGVIHAFSAPGVSTVFSNPGFQLEGSTILQCASTGCPATFGYWKHHAFPASMFVGGLASIGCKNYSATTLVNILNQSNSGGNAVTILGHQLIAAIANYDAGGTQTPAATGAIGSAISLLCANNIDLSSSFVQSSTTLGQQMVALSVTLDAYNMSGSSCEGNALAALATKKKTGKS